MRELVREELPGEEPVRRDVERLDVSFPLRALRLAAAHDVRGQHAELERSGAVQLGPVDRELEHPVGVLHARTVRGVGGHRVAVHLTVDLERAVVREVGDEDLVGRVGTADQVDVHAVELVGRQRRVVRRRDPEDDEAVGGVRHLRPSSRPERRPRPSSGRRTSRRPARPTSRLPPARSPSRSPGRGRPSASSTRWRGSRTRWRSRARLDRWSASARRRRKRRRSPARRRGRAARRPTGLRSPRRRPRTGRRAPPRTTRCRSLGRDRSGRRFARPLAASGSSGSRPSRSRSMAAASDTVTEVTSGASLASPALSAYDRGRRRRRREEQNESATRTASGARRASAYHALRLHPTSR